MYWGMHERALSKVHMAWDSPHDQPAGQPPAHLLQAVGQHGPCAAISKCHVLRIVHHQQRSALYVNAANLPEDEAVRITLHSNEGREGGKGCRQFLAAWHHWHHEHCPGPRLLSHTGCACDCMCGSYFFRPLPLLGTMKGMKPAWGDQGAQHGVIRWHCSSQHTSPHVSTHGGRRAQSQGQAHDEVVPCERSSQVHHMRRACDAAIPDQAPSCDPVAGQQTQQCR